MLKIGAGSLDQSGRRGLGYSVEALCDRHTVQIFLIDVTRMCDEEQKYAQGITMIMEDGRLAFRNKSDWIAHASAIAGSDKRTSKFLLLRRQTDINRANADASIKVLMLAAGSEGWRQGAGRRGRAQGRVRAQRARRGQARGGHDRAPSACCSLNLSVTHARHARRRRAVGRGS
jgi:hypothetical protein